MALMYFASQHTESSDELHDKMRLIFFHKDYDGDGITERDRRLTRLYNAAKSRSFRVSMLFHNDFDGDSVVTTDELRIG